MNILIFTQFQVKGYKILPCTSMAVEEHAIKRMYLYEAVFIKPGEKKKIEWDIHSFFKYHWILALSSTQKKRLCLSLK